MKKIKIIFLNKTKLRKMILVLVIPSCIIIPLLLHFIHIPVHKFEDPRSGIIVIDPGHGGVDGGTNRDGILEKDVNLDIAIRLREMLQIRGYQVIMTRDTDISLEGLSKSGKTRHQRDLNARMNIINNSNAQLFVSIHVNCNYKRTTTSGSILFFHDKYPQNRKLAQFIQESLNAIIVNDKKRAYHSPLEGNYFLLNYSKIPGVIVETAFISNPEEKKLLKDKDFQLLIAGAIAEGIDKYIFDSHFVFEEGQKE